MADKKNQKSGNDIGEIVVTAKQLGEILGVGDRMVRNLAEEGIVTKNSRGKYKLFESTKNYITLLKAQASGKGSIASGTGEYIDLDAERAKHERLKMQITEIKLLLIKGQVHKAEDVAAVITDMFTRIKSKLSAIPSKYARKLEGKKRGQIQELLTDEINNVLLELSAYDPADFYSDEHIEIDGEKLEALGINVNEN